MSGHEEIWLYKTLLKLVDKWARKTRLLLLDRSSWASLEVDRQQRDFFGEEARGCSEAWEVKNLANWAELWAVHLVVPSEGVHLFEEEPVGSIEQGLINNNCDI